MNETPVRLSAQVSRALRKHNEYGKAAKRHSLSYAANVALAAILGIAPPLTPREKMAKASKSRWRTQKRAAAKPRAKRARKTAE